MKNLQAKIMIGILNMRNRVESAIKDEEGATNIIAIILVIIVVIAVAIIFRDQITSIVEGLFTKITGQIDSF